jgi:valyl-tRNA synthetase
MPEISKAYEPQSVEDKWYDYWVKQGCFTADPARVSPKRQTYSIVIPPPNVTGVLHMGHVLNNTIQDILARKARMDGKEVLWLPGTDHAGIATERQVEKAIKKDERKSKQEIGREEFIKRVWTWKEKHGGIIIQQLKKLGCSCDWTRERFTMDPEYVRCVQKVFAELYKKGLIYRGKRMVNWCPASQTALSDEEVEMKSQKGFMYYFKVEVAESPLTPSLSPGGGEGERSPLTPALSPDGREGAGRATSPANDSLSPTGGEGKGEGAARQVGPVTDSEGRLWLTIATTRPETIPGDTAVAVNPKDTRYAHLIGKHVVRPLPPELPRERKLIPIIGDEHVDFEFGTGVLKVTPAHDKADFEIGQRHNLPLVDIMNPDATMNALAGQDLNGLDRFAARKVATEKLRELGALVEEKPYENNVGFSQRADVPIEPRLSEQWFLKYPGVEQAKECVEQTGSAGFQPAGAAAKMAALPARMRFHPDRWAKVYDHWLTNIQDWCISRQLWWGHRIPVWYRANPGPYDLRKTHAENLDSNYSVEECCQIESPGEGWQQDPDVLDTWFSSWLWPFATMGWTGDKSQDSKNPTLQAFYPTTDLVTGPDIIFFWVARMIMAGYEYMGEMPFRNVYFTGIIRDKEHVKMSKSKGNSPDPLELIAKYGADALRFGTMRSAPLGQDVLFDEKDVELGRNFCNKLWNACRYRQMQGGEVQGEIDALKLRSDDKWILLKLHQAIKEMNAAFAQYKFNEATATLYRFFWSEYCDWYVETTKAVLAKPVESLNRETLNRESVKSGESGEDLTIQRFNDSTSQAKRANVLAVMDFVLSHALRLFHPFLPFITEELWHGMGYAEDMPAEQGGRSILFALWPKPFDSDIRDHYALDDCYLELVDARFDLITKGRDLRRQANVPSNKKVKFILKPAQDLPPNDVEVMKLLLGADPFEVNASYEGGKGVLSTKATMGEIYLPLEGLVDIAGEIARLTKEIEKISSEIAKVEQKLANPNFVNKSPPEVVAEHHKRLEDWQAKLAHAQKALAALSES